LCPDVQIVKNWDIDIYETNEVFINGDFYCSYGSQKFEKLANNDGLSETAFISWFNVLPFSGQIICWNENVEY
jgi:hypothetical protein